MQKSPTPYEGIEAELKRLRTEVRKAYNKLAKQETTESLINQAVTEALKSVKVQPVQPPKKRKGIRNNPPKLGYVSQIGR